MHFFNSVMLLQKLTANDSINAFRFILHVYKKIFLFMGHMQKLCRPRSEAI